LRYRQAAMPFVPSPAFDAALLFAVDKHRTQIRKGSGVPYITHLLAVAASVAEFGGDEAQTIAALLHDVIEDQGVGEAEIAERFGPQVARIVVACTDSFTRPKPPWRARKEAYLEGLRHKPADIKLVVACDKLHNARSIARDLRDPAVGDAVWGRFSMPREDSLWYYRAVRDALAEGFEHRVIGELDDALREIGAR
jgi:(p)ppGpp synthase/HD superfamily hydrolase